MAVKVSVTKAEREALVWAASEVETQRKTVYEVYSDRKAAKRFEHMAGALRNLLAKIDAPPKPKDTGLGWIALRDSLKEHLGDRLALPPAPDGAWYAMQNRRIKSVGLTKGQADLIAKFLATWRRPTIAFEMVTGRLTDLLAGAMNYDRGGRDGNAREPVGGTGWGLGEFGVTPAFPD